MDKKKKLEKAKIDYIWKDRKRYFGLPLSFIRYRLSEDRLFHEVGFFTVKQDEIMLYRVLDVSMKMTLWQKIFGVGTIMINASDKTLDKLYMYNIKHPRKVKELLHTQVEKAKLAYRVRYSEMMGDLGMGAHGAPGGEILDLDGNGIPDILED